jgi:large subunit ribosomal protein L4
VLDAAAFDAPSTARAAELLHAHRGGSVLVALGDDEFVAAKSFRNLARVQVLHVDDVGVADLVGAATLVVSQAALDALTVRAKKEASA